MADMRLAGCQHFAFQEYKDPRGNKLFAGHSNGSASFRLAQVRVGEGKVPVSIVVYIDSTILKKRFQFDLFTVSVFVSYPISYPMS